MKRAIFTALLLGSLLTAEPVYFSGAGTTYHAKRDCSTLARSKKVFTSDRTVADQNGLHKCARCYGEHRAKTSSKRAWATEVR